MLLSWLATAAPVLDTGDPLGFFTNVASRLLATELNLDLTRIQIYPTNQYTPAVHRLLQVTANLYDATTNHTAVLGQDFPTVFRPLFARDISGNVFITGYTNVPSVSGAGDIALSAPFDASQVGVPGGPSVLVNVYGVPWIIGAKKGFPNFNEISMEGVVQITRKLQVTRSDTTPTAIFLSTNAQYIFSISNAIGVEFWNSYTNAFTNAVQVVVNDIVTMNLTNDGGYSGLASYPLSQTSNFTIWPGSVWLSGGILNTNNSYPFYIPISANLNFMTNQVYQWGGGFKDVASASWQPSTQLLLPHFGLVTTNRLQAFILATDKNNVQHVIDYVHFNGPISQRDLNAEIQTSLNTVSYDNMWDTNTLNSGLPWGIASQFGVSLGASFNGAYWDEADLNRVKAEIDGFSVFMGLSPPFQPLPAGYTGVYNSYVTNTAVQVPYTPTVTTYEYTSWQANDPLVHSLASDLNYSGFDPDANSVHTGVNKLANRAVLPLLPDIGTLNAHYHPWGKVSQALLGVDQNGYNRAYKDPLVKQSDNWNFPNGQPLSPDWIGQVHRGTPWQTIFLKATNILNLTGTTSGVTTWTNWTGNGNPSDAINTAPVNDWHMASLLSAIFNTNNLASRFPVNNPDPVAWQELFDGLTAFTNIPEALNAVLISSNSTEALVIASAIQSKRSVQPGQFFKDVGDILATPQLADQSPFLTGLNVKTGITDAAYEIIPSQLLSLLRADSIGSASLVDGQPLMQFTGYDGHTYAIQASSDLANWADVSTNCPANGVFSITNSTRLNADRQFYRSVLRR